MEPAKAPIPVAMAPPPGTSALTAGAAMGAIFATSPKAFLKKPLMRYHILPFTTGMNALVMSGC